MTSETARRLELVGANGNKLVADHWGDPGADCVVFLHGGGQTRHAWGGTAAYVANSGWQAVAVDLRGHGDSDWTADYVYRDFAADVISLAGQLPPRAVFVGASLGGISVIFAQDTFSRERPGQSLCRALVLVDIAPRANPAGVQRIMTFMRSGMSGFDSLEAAAAAVADYTRERKRSGGIDGLRKNLRQREDGRWYWHWDPRFLDVSRNPANRPIGLLEQAASTIEVPTLLVRGSKSDVLTEDGVDAFRRVVPHAEFVDVAGAGHMVAGDRNDAFTEAILKFLSDLRRHEI